MEFIKEQKKMLIGLGMCILLYAIMKIFMHTDINIIGPFYLVVIQKICIDAMLALGLNLITGITGQFSLGHAGFMAIGAYTVGLMHKVIPISLDTNIFIILFIILIATIAGGIFGVFIAIPTVRLRGDYLAIATLGFAEIIRITIQNVNQGFLGGSSGLLGWAKYTNFELVFFGLILCYLVCYNFIHSSFGRASISVREDEIAAETMGVALTKTKLIAFTIGTMMAGFAGALYAGNVGFIAPKDFGFLKSIEILMIVVIGGLGNINGTIIAAIVVNLVSTWLQDYAELRMIIYALVLILIMLFKSADSKFFRMARNSLGQFFQRVKP